MPPIESFRLRGSRIPHALSLAAVTVLAAASPAAAEAAVTVEAESMSVASGVVLKRSDAAASGGQKMVLASTSSIKKTVTTSAATSGLTIRARGEQCDGAPKLQVDVDGTRVLTTGVTSTTFADRSVALSLPKGSHTIKISFPNDYQRAGACDRNLHVDRVTLGAAPATTTTEVEGLTLQSSAPYGDNIADSAASAGRTMRMLGANNASGTVSTGAAGAVTVRARGDQCNGAPELKLTVDGKQVLAAAVPSASYGDYRAPVTLAQGRHSISVGWSNDYLSSSCDRNLYVDKVTFAAAAGSTPAPTPTPTPAPPAPTPTATPAPTTPAPTPTATPPASPTPAPTATPAPAPTTSGYWRSTFEGSSQEPVEWSTWGPSSAYGAWGQGQANEIDTASSFGIPGAPSGTPRVARLWHAASDPAIHHKLYKSFRANTFPSGIGALENTSPKDVSGRYISEFYIDSTGNVNSAGTQLMQFKEEYTTSGNVYHNDSQWYLEWFNWMDNPDDPRFAWAGRGMANNPIMWSAKGYLNRWITIEIRVYQWNRTEVWIDGVKMATQASYGQQAAGRTYFPPGSPELANVGTKSSDPDNGGGNVVQPLGYIFGAGNYTHKQSLVYLGRSMLLPLP